MLQRKLDRSTCWLIPHSSITCDAFWQVLLPLLLKKGERRGRASHPTADLRTQTYISKKTAAEQGERGEVVPRNTVKTGIAAGCRSEEKTVTGSVIRQTCPAFDFTIPGPGLHGLFLLWGSFRLNTSKVQHQQDKGGNYFPF